MSTKNKLCYHTVIAGLTIELRQWGKDAFTVQYGKAVTGKISYQQACLDLGASIIHALACEGKLDNG